MQNLDYNKLVEEVDILRSSFKEATHISLQRRKKRSTSSSFQPRLTNNDEALVHNLVEQMKDLDTSLVRKIRAVTDEMTIEPRAAVLPDDEVNDAKCVVKNLTCVTFPTMKQCQGIRMGGCTGEL